jgi:hypothetical protein
MSDTPIDFSPLDPLGDRRHFEQLMQGLHRAAAPELERRQLSQSIWWQLFAWRRPFFTAAAAALVILAGTAYLTIPTTPANEEKTDNLALALGVPTEVISWSVADSLPSTAQVFFPSEEN